MRKYKAGDKIVLDVLSIDDNRWYKIGGEYYSWWENPNYLDIVSEPLSEYTEKLEKKNENKQKRIEKLVERLHRQASEITRLLAENAELKGLNSTICDVCKHDEFLKETREVARAEGEEAAWELAKKMASMKFDEAAECFPDYDRPLGMRSLMNKYSYTEAAAKVAEWERMNEEICVGDIVRFRENHRAEFCVTDIYDDRLLYGINAEGDVYSDRDIELFEKTGRHIDIKSMLAQIGGGNDD